ncbi:hypothetical protein BC830DRAFT_1121081 [Chytriomyces sp. MP71]|nr:hypothetical protein BC830DRAFT_1121081 [Chytriomyces sp. MP71]
MYKALLSHCQSLLSQHHALARGTYKAGAGAVHESGLNGLDGDEFDLERDDFTEPIIIVDEKELLEEYWKENKIDAEPDRIFLEETVLGCVRHEKLIALTLKLFFKKTGGRYLKSEYNLFAVLSYLCLYRLDADLPFASLSKFFKQYNATKMARFLAFLFDSAHLVEDGILIKAWSTLLDRDYIKSKILIPLAKNSTAAKALIEELLVKSEKGMVPKKSSKPNTEAVPFVLTVSSPKKAQELPKLPPPIKARAIPKSVYTGTGELEALKAIKAENRRRVEEEQHKAQLSQFQITKRPPNLKKPCPQLAHEPPHATAMGPKAKPVPSHLFEPVPVKMTVATILREDALVRKHKEDEERMLAEAELTLRDASEFQTWKEDAKIKADEERKLVLEKLRLKVQLLHEDSFLARQEKVQENKDIVKEVKGEKGALKTLNEIARKELDIENKKKIEDVHEIMEGVVKAKERVIVDKQKKAADIVNETQMLMEKAQREAEEELARKIELIQQIRLLEKAIPPVGAIVKTLDLTETSNLGLLGEMSIIELHERLAHIKVREAEHADERRREIIHEKQVHLAQITEKLEDIDRERQERRRKRLESQTGASSRSPSSISVDGESSIRTLERSVSFNNDPAIRELQEKLEAKRALRRHSKTEFSSKKLSGTVTAISKAQTSALKTKPSTSSSIQSALSEALPTLSKRNISQSSKKVSAQFAQKEHLQNRVKRAAAAKVGLESKSIDEDGFDFHLTTTRSQLEEERLKILADIAAAEADIPIITLAVPQGSIMDKAVKFADSVESLEG